MLQHSTPKVRTTTVCQVDNWIRTTFHHTASASNSKLLFVSLIDTANTASRSLSVYNQHFATPRSISRRRAAEPFLRRHYRIKDMPSNWMKAPQVWRSSLCLKSIFRISPDTGIIPQHSTLTTDLWKPNAEEFALKFHFTDCWVLTPQSVIRTKDQSMNRNPVWCTLTLYDVPVCNVVQPSPPARHNGDLHSNTCTWNTQGYFSTVKSHVPMFSNSMNKKAEIWTPARHNRHWPWSLLVLVMIPLPIPTHIEQQLRNPQKWSSLISAKNFSVVITPHPHLQWWSSDRYNLDLLCQWVHNRLAPAEEHSNCRQWFCVCVSVWIVPHRFGLVVNSWQICVQWLKKQLWENVHELSFSRVEKMRTSSVPASCDLSCSSVKHVAPWIHEQPDWRKPGVAVGTQNHIKQCAGGGVG